VVDANVDDDHSVRRRRVSSSAAARTASSSSRSIAIGRTAVPDRYRANQTIAELSS
jgi:hypothetical protein